MCQDKCFDFAHPKLSVGLNSIEKSLGSLDESTISPLDIVSDKGEISDECAWKPCRPEFAGVLP
jgi:hypothetical protein